MTIDLFKPALYRAEGTPDVPDHPALLGGACRCGHVFFPWQTYGCERCGGHGDALTPLALGGRGTVESSAAVHLHASPDRPTPFTIAAVRLDAGPVVRTLALQPDSGAPLKPGDRVVTTLAESANARDLRFTRPD